METFIDKDLLHVRMYSYFLSPPQTFGTSRLLIGCPIICFPFHKTRRVYNDQILTHYYERSLKHKTFPIHSLQLVKDYPWICRYDYLQVP